MKFDYLVSSKGSKILYIQDQSSPSIEIGIYFATGSRSDYTSKLGMAHLLEHLNFQGTKKRPINKEIVLEIESLGGNFDAFTGKEYTGYMIKAPADKFDKVMDVLFDLVFQSSILQDQIEKETNVIIEEIKMYDDVPSDKVQSIFQKNLFPNNNLGADIAGDSENLLNIKREDLFRFRKDNYTLDNMLITIAGHFDLLDTQSKINEYMSTIQEKSNKLVELETERTLISKKVINITKDIAQANIIIGGYGLPRSIDNKYEIRLGNMILSGGMGSLLFQKLREELRLVYYANASHSGYQEIGTFQVEMGVDAKKIKFATDEAIKCLKAFIEGKFSDRDFERAKNYLMGLTLTQLETSMDLASWNAIKLLYSDSRIVENNEDIIKAIAGLTKSRVLDIWKEIINEDNILICNLGPSELIY